MMEEYDPFNPTEDAWDSPKQPVINDVSGKNVNLMDSGYVDDQEDGVEDVDEFDGSEDDDDDDGDDSEEEEEEVEEAEEDTGAGSDDEEGERCPVCLCRFKGQDIGTPESCDHNFCLDCIQEWAKNVNTCPADRTVFHLIMAKHGLGEEIFMRIPVEDRNTLNDPEHESDEEDLTLCEICGRGDGEDRLLLCDGCDLGFHLDCLTPPLRTVPVEEWFCNKCSSRKFAAQVPETRSAFRRQIARTLVSERVRAALQETRLRQTRSGRLLQQYSDEEDMAAEFVTAADVESSRTRTSDTTRTKRRVTRRTTKKRTTGRRRKSGKKRLRKTRRKSKPSSIETAPGVVTPKTRIAKHLGLVQPRKGKSIPDVRNRDRASVGTDLAGCRPLSILGDKNELLAFDDGSDTEKSEPASFTKKPISRYSALSKLSNKPIRQPLANRCVRRPVTVSEPVSTSTASCDLLGAIMQGQDLLHKDAQQVKIARDGSLHIRERTPSPPPRQPKATPIDQVEKSDCPGNRENRVCFDNTADDGAEDMDSNDDVDSGAATPVEDEESGIIDTMPIHRQLSALQQMAGYGSEGSSAQCSDAGDDTGEGAGAEYDHADGDGEAGEHPADGAGDGEASDNHADGAGGGEDGDNPADGASDGEAGDNPADGASDGEAGDNPADGAGDGEAGDNPADGAGDGEAGESAGQGEANQGDEDESQGGEDGDENDGEDRNENNDNQEEEEEEAEEEEVEEGEEAHEVEEAEEAMEEEQEVEEGAEEGQEAPELTEEVEEGALEEGMEVQGEDDGEEAVEGHDLVEEGDSEKQTEEDPEGQEGDETSQEQVEDVEEDGNEAVEAEVEAQGDGEEVMEGDGEEGEVDDGDATPGLEEDDASATPNLEEDQQDKSVTGEPSTPELHQDRRIVQERTPVKGRPQAPSSDTMVLYSDEMGDAEVDSETMEEYAPKMPVSELPRIPKLNKNRLQVEIRGAAMDEEEDRLKRERRKDYEDDDRRDDRDYKRRDRDRRGHRYDEDDDRRGDSKRSKRSSSRDRNRSRRSRSREDRKRRDEDTRRRSRSRDRSRRGSRRRDREPSYERSPDRRRRKREREDVRSSSGRRDKDEFGRDLSSRDRYPMKDAKYDNKDYYDNRSKDDDRNRKRGKRDDDYYDSYGDNYREDKYNKYDRDDNSSGHGAKYSREDSGSKYNRDREDRKRGKDHYKDDNADGRKFWDGNKRDEPMYSQPYQQPYSKNPEPVQSIQTLGSSVQPDVDHQPIDMDLTYDPADPTDDTSPSPPMDALIINEDAARESVLVNVPVQQPHPFVQEHPPSFRPNEPPPPIPMFPNLPPGMAVPGAGPPGMSGGPRGPPGPPPPPGGPDLLRHPVHLVSPQNLPNLPGLPQNIRQGLVLNHMLLNPLNRLPLMAGVQLPPGVQQLQNRMVVPPGMTLPPGARVPFEPGMEQVRLMTQMELGNRPPTSVPINMVAVSEAAKGPNPQVPPPEILRNIPPPRLPGGLPVNQGVLRQVRPGSPDGPPPPPPPPPKMAVEHEAPKKTDPTMDNIATLQRIKTLGSLLNTQVAMASLATLKPAASDDGPNTDFKAPNPPKKVDFKVPPPPRLAKEDKPAEIVEPVAMDMSSPNMDDFSPPPMDMLEIELETPEKTTEKPEKKGKENKDSPKKKHEKESPKTKTKESSRKKDRESSKKKEDKDDWSKLVGVSEEKKKKKKSSGSSGGATSLSDDFMKKMNRQERVIEEVKLAVKPHYAAKKITKEEYKELLRKSVPKICNSRSGDINPAKIKAFVDVYVGKIRQRKKRQGEVHSSTSPSAIDSTALAKYAIPDRIKEKVKAKEMEKIKKVEAFMDKSTKKHKEKKKKH